MYKHGSPSEDGYYWVRYSHGTEAIKRVFYDTMCNAMCVKMIGKDRVERIIPVAVLPHTMWSGPIVSPTGAK